MRALQRLDHQPRRVEVVEVLSAADRLTLVDSWHPLGRMATIDEIGEVCAFLASDEAAFVTGQVICPDGGAALGYRR